MYKPECFKCLRIYFHTPEEEISFGNLFCAIKFLIIVLIYFNFSAHPWVREGGDASEIPIDISVLNNMRQFVKYSRLKQFALRVTQFFKYIAFFKVETNIVCFFR